MLIEMIKNFSVKAIAAMAILVALAATPAQATQAGTSPQPPQMSTASLEVNMHPEYAKSIARMAYIWGYPMVNMMNRRTALSAAPEPGRLGDVLPAAPIGQIAMLYDYIDPGQNSIFLVQVYFPFLKILFTGALEKFWLKPVPKISS